MTQYEHGHVHEEPSREAWQPSRAPSSPTSEALRRAIDRTAGLARPGGVVAPQYFADSRQGAKGSCMTQSYHRRKWQEDQKSSGRRSACHTAYQATRARRRECTASGQGAPVAGSARSHEGTYDRRGCTFPSPPPLITAVTVRAYGRCEEGEGGRAAMWRRFDRVRSRASAGPDRDDNSTNAAAPGDPRGGGQIAPAAAIRCGRGGAPVRSARSEHRRECHAPPPRFLNKNINSNTRVNIQ